MEISPISKARCKALTLIERQYDEAGSAFDKTEVFRAVREAFNIEIQALAEAKAENLRLRHLVEELSRPRGIVFPDGKSVTWTGRELRYKMAAI
jgi:hypothetical protein